MKWSRYNVMFKKSKGDGYLLYNTMSGAFLELCNEDASVLEKIRDGKFLATELEPKALRFLTENGDLERAMSNSEKLCQLCKESPEDLKAYSEIHEIIELLNKSCLI